MTGMAAAVGLGQLKRIDGYIEEYTAAPRVMDAATGDCDWLRACVVPDGAGHSRYIRACTWQDDKAGPAYYRFKEFVQELVVPLRFGFTGPPAYTFDIFEVTTACHQPNCPIQCPYCKGDYESRAGLRPTADDLIPRLVQTGLVETPSDEVNWRAGLLRQAIALTERG
jgi:hypothetical protein